MPLFLFSSLTSTEVLYFILKYALYLHKKLNSVSENGVHNTFEKIPMFQL